MRRDGNRRPRPWRPPRRSARRGRRARGRRSRTTPRGPLLGPPARHPRLQERGAHLQRATAARDRAHRLPEAVLEPCHVQRPGTRGGPAAHRVVEVGDDVEARAAARHHDHLLEIGVDDVGGVVVLVQPPRLGALLADRERVQRPDHAVEGAEVDGAGDVADEVRLPELDTGEDPQLRVRRPAPVDGGEIAVDLERRWPQPPVVHERGEPSRVLRAREPALDVEVVGDGERGQADLDGTGAGARHRARGRRPRAAGVPGPLAVHVAVARHRHPAIVPRGTEARQGPGHRAVSGPPPTRSGGRGRRTAVVPSSA